MTLRDWLPSQAHSDEYPHLKRHLDVEVVERNGYPQEVVKCHQFPHKHIYSWCLLANGYHVGFNENPAIGWSFPVKKYNQPKETK